MNTQSNFQIYNASAGSGKTFALVKEYLKILYKSDSLYSFQNILAITFTNKAAAEMKERILNSLMEFSKLDTENNTNDLFKKIVAELDLEPSEIQNKSIKIIKNILNNYGAFNITTIDSFTYKLIRSFAFDLGIALNFEVEMDAISLLNEAVDVLISKIGEDKSLTKTLIDFSISKANEDKSWDISKDLKEIAKLLLNENDILQVNKIKQKSITDFTDLQTNINKQLKETEKQFAIIGNNGLELINDSQIEHKDFYYSQFPKHFSALINDVSKIDFNPEKSLGKSITNEIFYTKGKPQEIKDTIDSIIPSLLDLYYESKNNYKNYLLNKLIGKSLIPLAILRSINNVLSEIKSENNIRLISEFNQLISTHLKEQPSAFIYEKIGERFRHYFIDEMQDTSSMQWKNMIPLLDNVLTSENIKGETGSLLLVGDAKQAIYRWRGGKAEQFIELSSDKGKNPFLIPKNTNQLDTNWRSYSEIIDFNNRFFQHSSKYLKNEAYQELYHNGNKQKENHKKGGYVEIQFIEEGLKADEKLLIYPEKVLEIINNISDEFEKKDICILTRTRKQGVAVAEYLTHNNIDIISSETLLLQNSTKVSFIIDLLTFINQPENKEAQFELLFFLHKHLNLKYEDKHSFFTELLELGTAAFYKKLETHQLFFDLDYFKSLSLYESIEYIIKNFKLTSTSDAYLQFFLDLILDFSFKKNESLGAFLNYWTEKKDSLSIVVSSEKNAVNIMTIHKSKGLEFPVVIYPFDLDIYKQQNPKVWYTALDKEKYNNFDSTLINYSSALTKIGEVGEKLYHEQREELELDNFNLLYVALTRAKEQLYIISELRKEDDEPKYYAQLFINYLKDKGEWNPEQTTYFFGNSKRLSKKTISNQNNIEQENFISSDWRQHNISISPNNSIDDKTENARQYGNLIHEILAKIEFNTEIDTSINYFIRKGLINNSDKNDITQLINKVANHPLLREYFTDKYKIMNEREILSNDNQILIPDRLIFDKNKVVIADYKTGKPEKKHHQQITTYANTLELMNFSVTKKLLIYINESIQVIEVE